jgi:hypothetical protein
MAELEIHHEIEGEQDPLGQKVGVLAAVMAVVLAIVTILSHRTHTDAILLKAGTNDDWQHYQSVRVKYHSLELGEDLVGVLAPAGQSDAKLAEYKKGMLKYDAEAKKIEAGAREKQEAAEKAETRALRYDLGEGLLEIALVLSSLYFIARRKLFPAVSLVAGTVGIIIAATGLMV